MATGGALISFISVPAPYRHSPDSYSAPVAEVQLDRRLVSVGLAAVLGLLALVWLARDPNRDGLWASLSDLIPGLGLLTLVAAFMSQFQQRVGGVDGITVQDGRVEFDGGERLRPMGCSRWEVTVDRKHYVRVRALAESMWPLPLEIEVGPFATSEEADEAEQRFAQAVKAARRLPSSHPKR